MRKSFKKALSLVLAAALAFSTPIATNATSAGAAVTGDVVDVTESMELNDAIGDGTTTGGFFGNFTKYYRLTGDFNVTFTMETTSDVALNWNTPIVVVTNDEDRAPAENPGNYVEYVVARSDNYCVAGGAHMGCRMGKIVAIQTREHKTESVVCLCLITAAAGRFRSAGSKIQTQCRKANADCQ